MTKLRSVVAVVLALSFTYSFVVSAKTSSKKTSVERLDIDPVLQGIWYMHIVSKDGCKTQKKIEPPLAFCRVRALSVTLGGDEPKTIKVQKVVISRDEDGDTLNAILFNTGAVWIATQVKPGIFLVRVYASTTAKEFMRIMVTVGS